TTQKSRRLSEPGVGWWYQFQVAAATRWGSRGFHEPGISPPVAWNSEPPRPPSPPRHLREGVLRIQAMGTGASAASGGSGGQGGGDISPEMNSDNLTATLSLEIHWSPPEMADIPVTEYRVGPTATHELSTPQAHAIVANPLNGLIPKTPTFFPM
ncbi:unnamed protein product, partial [Protopolystoma xenopodis]